MANMLIPFVSVESSVYNEVYNQVIADVSKIIGANHNTLRVLYNSTETVKTDNKANAVLSSDNNTPVTNAIHRLTVRVNEEMDEESIGSSIVNRRDHFPIFRDPEIGVSITPVYIRNNIEFEFSYITPSKADANNMRDLIRMHLSRTLNTFEHDVSYTMIIPEEVEEFITMVHGLKTRLDENPMSLVQYFDAYSNNRVHVITDMVNLPNSLLGVKEKQMRVLGSFGLTNSPPDLEVDNTRNQYRVKFTYFISLDLPKSITMSFPPIIGNKELPVDYLAVISKYNNNRRSRDEKDYLHLGRSNTILSFFNDESMMRKIVDQTYPINVPDYDWYNEPSQIKGYGTIMTVLCTVEESDMRTLFNLKDMGDYAIAPNILKYISRGNHKKVTDMYQSFIYIGLEQEGRHFGSGRIEITEDLDVKLLDEPDLARPIRISIRSCVDPSFLSTVALEEFNQDDDLFEAFLYEYIELGVQMRNSDLDLLTARDNLIKRLIATKFIKLHSEKNYDKIKKLIYIINTDPTLSRMIGRLLVSGLWNLYQLLIGKCICYVDKDESVKLHSESKREVEEETIRRDEYIKYVYKEWKYWELVPNDFYYISREGVFLRGQRTAMAFSVVALREH